MKKNKPVKQKKPRKKWFTRQNIKNLGIDLAADIGGSILYAVGLYTFAKSASFAPGGISGLALIVNHLWGLPIGMVSLALNIPVILVCFRVVGRSFLLKSFRTMLISTVFLDFVFPYFPVYQGDVLLAALFAGGFLGAGLAIIYIRGSSTGGTDFLTLTLKKLRPHFSIGQLTLALDSVIIALGGVVFGNIDAVLYGVISTFACSTVIDKLMYGAGSGKLAMIITTQGAQVAARISLRTDRGSTIVPATGAYSGEGREMLLCACGKAEVIKVRNAAHEIDPGAFVMITEASEVIGEGFTPPQPTH